MNPVTFEVAMEDLMVGVDYFCNSTPTIRRSVRWRRWVLPLLWLAVVFGVLVPIRQVHPGILVFFGACAALMAGYYPRIYRWQVRRVHRKMYADARVPPMGTRTVGIEGDQFIQRSASGESRWDIETIEDIVASGPHVIVRFGHLQVIVIARDKVTSGDLDGLVAALQRRPAPFTGHDVPTNLGEQTEAPPA